MSNVRPGMPAYGAELFGPVAAIISAADEADAIRIANDSPYGLGAAVFTKNKKRGERIARDQLDSGCAFVNEFVRSHPALPSVAPSKAATVANSARGASASLSMPRRSVFHSDGAQRMRDRLRGCGS